MVDLAKSALVDFANDFEVLSDFLDHLWHGLRVFGVGIRISGMFNLNCNLLFYLFSDDDRINLFIHYLFCWSLEKLCDNCIQSRGTINSIQTF